MSIWTANDIPNLKGKVAIVTGANSGIGFPTALELARKEARVYLACRDQGRGEDAVKRIKDQVPSADAIFAKLDVSDLGSVRDFAKFVKSKESKVDLLVNNAGIMALPTLEHTKDGFEKQMGTNHIGHFALTGLLFPLLKASKSSRVVSVSSSGHRFFGTKFDLDDFDYKKDPSKYSAFTAYGNSKLANLLFTLELNKRAKKSGLNVISVGCHPGGTATNLVHSGVTSRDSYTGRFTAYLSTWFLQNEAMGSLPTLFAATSPDVAGNDYYGPNGWFGSELGGYPKKCETTELAKDELFSSALWKKSEELTGVKFGI